MANIASFFIILFDTLLSRVRPDVTKGADFKGCKRCLSAGGLDFCYKGGEGGCVFGTLSLLSWWRTLIWAVAFSLLDLLLNTFW